MGLRITAAMAGLPTPSLFTDAGYTRSTSFGLSTSNISNPGHGAAYYDFGGFGPPIRDSYGVAYTVQEHAVQFMVSSHPECKTRDAARFAGAIEAALADIFGLVQRVTGATSKL